MSKELYFKTGLPIGDLYMDKVLLEFELEPAVFVCIDKLDNHYLCVCYDNRYVAEWIIKKVSIKVLLQILTKHMDLYDAMKSSDSDYIKCSFDGKHEVYTMIPNNEINEQVLPDKGTMLETNIDTDDYYYYLVMTCPPNQHYSCDQAASFAHDNDTEIADIFKMPDLITNNVSQLNLAA